MECLEIEALTKLIKSSTCSRSRSSSPVPQTTTCLLAVSTFEIVAPKTWLLSKSNLSKSNRPCKFNITKKYTGHLPNSKTVGIYLERYFGRLEVGITTGKTKTVRGNKEPVSKKKVLYFQID